MKLDPVIKTITSMKNIDRFSVTEIRTAYLALMSDEVMAKRVVSRKQKLLILN